MQPGEHWHQQIVESYNARGSIQLGITNEHNIWHSYFNSHLNASPTLSIYADGNSGLAILSLVGGYARTLTYHKTEDAKKDVLVVAWDQTELDTAVTNARLHGELTVIKTLRIQDNLTVTL